jgi:N-acetylneuraminate synthase
LSLAAVRSAEDALSVIRTNFLRMGGLMLTIFLLAMGLAVFAARSLRLQDINLRNIPMLQRTFGIPVGFSDHSQGTAIPLAAIALGACVVEKHFTLDPEMPGWDHWVSADPGEMSKLVAEGRNIFTALGSEVRRVNAEEQLKKLAFRRCCVAARPLPAGHVLGATDLDYKRPGAGIHPDETRYLIGRTLKRDLGEDDILHWDDLI